MAFKILLYMSHFWLGFGDKTKAAAGTVCSGLY